MALPNKTKGEDAPIEETAHSVVISDYLTYKELRRIGYTKKVAANHLSRSEEQIDELVLQFEPKKINENE